MTTNYVLVDFENVQPDMSGLIGTDYRVIVFFGAKQQSSRHHYDAFGPLLKLGPILTVEEVPQSGRNALDMHIAYTMGEILQREPDAVIHVISRDTDFDPLIDTLKRKRRSCSRSKDVSALVKKRAAPTAPAAPAAGLAPRKPRGSASAAAKKSAPPPVDLEAIVDNLRSMTGKPSTRRKLGQAIAAYCKHHGGDRPEKVVEQAIDELISQGLVSQSGAKVNYHLG